MAEMGKYIYGVINSPAVAGSRQSSDNDGRDNTAFRLFAPKDYCEDNETNGIYAILHQDISAVVSDAKIVNYTHMPKDILARLLVKHQKVIERIMSLEYVTLPVRLGTFAIDETEVKDILNKGYRLIKEIIDKIGDKIEIDVACTWNDFPLVIQEVGEEKEIKEFKERLLGDPKKVTVDDQIKVGFMVKKALDMKREKYAFNIQNTLRTISQDFKTHELMNDKMVLNVAFLIEKSKQNNFNRKIEELNSEFSERLNFRCVGPLPPYSFYTLEIKKMQFDQIDWARRKLGLNGTTTKEGIKKAYQIKSFSSHPDKNPNTPGIEKEFDDVNRAYKILTDYCLATEQAGQINQYSFKEEEFKKNAILVKVMG